MDRSAIVQGYAGVYSSFLLHAERAAERYGVAAHDILQRQVLVLGLEGRLLEGRLALFGCERRQSHVRRSFWWSGGTGERSH